MIQATWPRPAAIRFWLIVVLGLLLLPQPGSARSQTVPHLFAASPVAAARARPAPPRGPPASFLIYVATQPATSLISSVAVSGTIAYLGDQTGLTLLDITTPARPVRLSSLDLSASIDDIAVVGSYAYLAASTGLLIVDVSVPRAPALSASNTQPKSARAVQVVGDRAYVGAGELYIVDVRDPKRPRLLNTYRTTGPAWSVAVAGNLAYLGAFDFSIVDASDPLHLKLLGTHPFDDVFYVQVSGINAYVLDGGHGRDAAFVALTRLDVSTPANPIEQGVYFPSIPGTLMAQGLGSTMYTDGSRFIVPEIVPAVEFLDMTDFNAPRLLARYETLGYVRDIAVSNDAAYLAESDGGLEIVDLHDIAHPTFMAAYPWHSLRLPLVGG